MRYFSNLKDKWEHTALKEIQPSLITRTQRPLVVCHDCRNADNATYQLPADIHYLVTILTRNKKIVPYSVYGCKSYAEQQVRP